MKGGGGGSMVELRKASADATKSFNIKPKPPSHHREVDVLSEMRRPITPLTRKIEQEPKATALTTRQVSFSIFLRRNETPAKECKNLFSTKCGLVGVVMSCKYFMSLAGRWRHKFISPRARTCAELGG